MDYSKELLLFVATTFVGVGATKLPEEPITGAILLLVGAVVFVGRGFYKMKFSEHDRLAKNAKK